MGIRKTTEVSFCAYAGKCIFMQKIYMEKQNWDVFISYSSKDFAIIQKIVNDFKNNNITYWFDDEQINPGDFIIPQIEKGLDNSQYVILCFSRNQLESGWSRAEYESVLYTIIHENLVF